MKHVNVVKQGRVATVTFKREAKSNALSFELMRELTEAARSFESDCETSAIVLTGRADCFSMGFDLKCPETQGLRSKSLAEQRVALATGGRMCAAWEALAPLTICAIEGWCLGGGLALAASLDLRVGGQTALYALPEIERGLNLSWGAVPRIINLVGPARAKRLILLAEELGAEKAEAWGLIDQRVDDGLALDTALELAKRAAKQPPVALRLGKQSINAYANAFAASASHADVDQFMLALQSMDGEEGIASFFEKREAKFEGR